MPSLRKSRIKRLLKEGQLPLTIKSSFTDPRMTELAGFSGFDGMWLCNEHSPTDWTTLEHTIRAARLHDMDTLVRVSKGGYSDYVRPLEAGATGIIVPHVESVEEAEQIVSWTRFHPIGKRPLDGACTDGMFGAVPQADYLEHSNQEKIVILQIESPEGLEQVEKIAAIPGFDGFLFGPGDFSHRIGKAGQLSAPEVATARRRVAEAARANGKFAMTSGIFLPMEEMVAEGINVFNIVSEASALRESLTAKLASVRTTALSLGDVPCQT